MNNSKITNLEEKEEKLLFLQKQQGELAQVIESINRVEANEDWQKLKRLLLDGIVASLEKQLLSETAKDEISPPKIYRLQGQLMWAKKYSDLKKLSEAKRQQIENIKNQINEKNPRDGAL
mgnify:CR=1 FL=1